jgi:hypothetical protein
MDKINWPAVRAFNRASAPMWEGQVMGYAMDHAICPDGYGTASLDEMYAAAEHAMAARVGARFNLTADALLDMWQASNHYQHDCLWKARVATAYNLTGDQT